MGYPLKPIPALLSWQPINGPSLIGAREACFRPVVSVSQTVFAELFKPLDRFANFAARLRQGART